MSEKEQQIADTALATTLVDLIRDPKISREDSISLVRTAMRAARSGGAADSARSAGAAMLRAFDAALAHKSPEVVTSYDELDRETKIRS